MEETTCPVGGVLLPCQHVIHALGALARQLPWKPVARVCVYQQNRRRNHEFRVPNITRLTHGRYVKCKNGKCRVEHLTFISLNDELYDVHEYR